MDAARAFPRLTSLRYTGAGRDTASATLLANRDIGALVHNWTGAAFDVRRNTLGELVDHRHYWAVLADQTPAALQPYHGFCVREVDSERLAAATTSFTGSPVSAVQDASQAMLWPLGVRAGSAAQDWASASLTGYLDGSKQVRVDRGGATGPATLAWAIVEWGSVWNVTRLEGTVTTRGADVPLDGAGSQPWSSKFYVATQRVPAGADDLADQVLVRTSKSNPDLLVLSLPAGGTAGTYTVSVYVLHHPLLSVQHWDTVDLAASYPPIGVNTIEEYSGIPTGPPPDQSAVSIIAHGDGIGANTEYPRAHWGYTLAPDGRVFFRRGRVGTRGQNYSAQAVTWPNPSQAGSRVGPGHTTTSYQYG